MVRTKWVDSAAGRPRGACTHAADRGAAAQWRPAASPPSTAQPATAPASRFAMTTRHAAASVCAGRASAADAIINSGIGRVAGLAAADPLFVAAIDIEANAAGLSVVLTRLLDPLLMEGTSCEVLRVLSRVLLPSLRPNCSPAASATIKQRSLLIAKICSEWGLYSSRDDATTYVSGNWVPWWWRCS